MFKPAKKVNRAVAQQEVPWHQIVEEVPWHQIVENIFIWVFQNILTFFPTTHNNWASQASNRHGTKALDTGQLAFSENSLPK